MAYNEIFKRSRIPVANHPKIKQNYRDEHITSFDFCQLGCAKRIELKQGDKIEIDFRAFARAASLAVPTFGRAELNIRAFFVPYRTVMPSFTDFIEDAPHTFASQSGSRGIQNALTQVKNIHLVALVLSDASAVASVTLDNYREDEVPDKNEYDIVSNCNTSSTFSDSTKTYFKLGKKGAAFYKTLTQLGYAPDFFITSSNVNSTFNALPLLSLFKIYADWYYPAQYQSEPVVTALNKVFTYDAQSYTLEYSDLATIYLTVLNVFYDADYFTGAFDNPIAPSSSTYSSISILDPTSGPSSTYAQSQVYTQSNGTPALNSKAVGGTSQQFAANVTQFAIEALSRVSSYMHRHQLAGSKALDRYLARFGVTLPAEKLNRCVYLGNHVVPLMTGDVMSTASTGQEDYGSVGDYAGKGFVTGNDGHFEFETQEYGMFMLLYSFVPAVGYYQGGDPFTYHRTRLDLYTPEFDGIGNRAIRQSEIYQPIQDTFLHPIEEFTGLRDGIFGYIPQYAEYKVGRDTVSGDFRLGSRAFAGLMSPSWHMMRDVSDFWASGEDIKHSISFLDSAADAENYDRIFQYTDANGGDHFSCHFFFGITKWTNALPLFDNFEWAERGKEINMHINGSKLD